MIKTNENQITFGGTLGKDLTIKEGNNGKKPFAFTSVVQTTFWAKPNGETGFNERSTWMNIKFNDKLLNKINQHGGLWKGDEIVIKGQLVQRKIGDEGHILTEIQVDSILSHLPIAVRKLAKEAGINQSAQPVNTQAPQYNQQNAPQYNQQNAPQYNQQNANNTAPQYANNTAPQYANNTAPQYANNTAQQQSQSNNRTQEDEWSNTEFYGSSNQ
ncbi:single-stranded DNA-binding protein [uncultured Pseudoalteromonas sp.]|uniref:single-stranded DNA-binding protein n=1 Tax=uncultured Pseudoalteromonas sp. TaxID=114053 RepID=UPI002598AA2C|nr:single-stranded DNA-binding protein [uncultured Pseudoalteromonas sp.]